VRQLWRRISSAAHVGSRRGWSSKPGKPGIARDNGAFLRLHDQLRGTKEITDLKVDQVKGKTPMQFTFNFRWEPGGVNEH